MSNSKKYRPAAVTEAIGRAEKHLSTDLAPLIKHIEFLESELDRAADIASLRADAIMSLNRQIIEIKKNKQKS